MRPWEEKTDEFKACLGVSMHALSSSIHFFLKLQIENVREYIDFELWCEFLSQIFWQEWVDFHFIAEVILVFYFKKIFEVFRHMEKKKGNENE